MEGKAVNYGESEFTIIIEKTVAHRGGRKMTYLIAILFFVLIFGIYDMTRNINKSIQANTEEIQKLREEIKKS